MTILMREFFYITTILLNVCVKCDGAAPANQSTIFAYLQGDTDSSNTTLKSSNLL